MEKNILKISLENIEELTNGILERLEYQEMRNSAIELNEIVIKLDNIFILLESTCKLAEIYEEQINSVLDILVEAFNRCNVQIIKVNLIIFKLKIDEIKKLI